MDFPQTGHRVVIEQRFHGVDVFNYLRMSINVYGTVPSISHGSKIEIADYEEEHHKTGLGKTNFLFSTIRQFRRINYFLFAAKVNSGHRVDVLSASKDRVSTYRSLSTTLSTLKSVLSRRSITPPFSN